MFHRSDNRRSISPTLCSPANTTAHAPTAKASSQRSCSRPREYNGTRAYRQSKLAEILFTIDLARELEGSGITVNALHPATFMNTRMVRDFGAPRSTVEEGALAILKLATSAELDGKSGLYFNGQEEAQADAQAYDPQARQQLNRLSLELTCEGP
jgi:NAD(P)-dependent dehydrogenase (short-subunit alcohol dehydrogenase family)